MARRCPHCKVVSNFDSRGGPSFFQQLESGSARIALEECHNCSQTMAVVRDEDGKETAALPSLEMVADDELPGDVKTAFRQAVRSLNEGIWDGCVVMCRRALQEATDHLGAEGKNLYDKIEHLATQNRITPELGKWAHEGRLAGNLGAHGDKVKKWADQIDAEEIVEFCRWFFRYIYVLPAQLEERRERLDKGTTTGS